MKHQYATSCIDKIFFKNCEGLFFIIAPFEVHTLFHQLYMWKFISKALKKERNSI